MSVLSDRIDEARRDKAERIVLVLRGDRVPPEHVAHLTDVDRHILEARAGVRRGSNQTWRLVADLMAGSIRWKARCRTCGHGAPDGVNTPPKPANHEGVCAR
jgi:hypothetical protein